MNDFQRKNIELTKHATERFIERGKSKKRMLNLIRRAEKAYEVSDKAYFIADDYMFVCKQYPRHTLVLTAFRRGL